MDKEALAAEESMGSGPGSKASPTVVGFLSGTVDEIEAAILAGEDGGQRGLAGILWNRVESSLLQAGKGFD